MNITRDQARVMVEAVMSTLWERRPFKHDLGTMMWKDATEEDQEAGRGGPLWQEMMQEMENSVARVVTRWENEMGEELELTDMNGNVVKVSLYHVLDKLADAVRDRVPYKISTGKPDEWLSLDLTKE